MKVQVLPTSLANQRIARIVALGSLTLASVLVGTGLSASGAPDHGLTRSFAMVVAHYAESDSPLGRLHGHALIPPQNPATNVAPTSAMYDNCATQSPTSIQITSCDQETVAAIDTARASEGVGPMTLPVGYDQMPPNEQILVVSNLERTDRGLAPVTGLSSSLDALALKGARDNTDPPFPNPFYGTGGGGNWASTSSVLFADFLFMYDDGPGPGGINIDCTTTDTSGCWGHRDNILGDYDQPLLMGAATVSGTSLTEEFIGGDNVDKPDDSAWSSLATLFPVELSTSTVTLNPGTGAPKSATVTVWDSGVNMNVTATVTPADSEWSLAAYDCNLQPGTSCPLTLYLAPVPGGVTSATLRVTGPNGSIDVALNTTPVPPTIPGTPTKVVAQMSSSRVRVSWSAPASNGGVAILGYRVYSTPAGLHCVTSATTCVITHGGGHGSYQFSVVAQNALGLSAHSTHSNRVTFK